MNINFENRLIAELEELKKAGTYKRLRHLTSPMDARVDMEEAGDVVVLSSNNYLGLANDPGVVKAGIAGLKRYGAGTASVRFICGTYDIHRELEAKLAAFLGFDAALTYVSCWAANEGLLPTLGTAGNTIISDELNHASIIDGCRLAGARTVRFKHADMLHLESRLREAEGTAFVVTDGVFSMEGDLANLPEIVALAERYGAVTIVDDSHGIGVMGKTGRGIIEHFGLRGKVDVVTGTLGKALGGAAGGFVAASSAVVETLVQRSRTQLFSNALPATVASSALAAVKTLEEHPKLIEKLRANVAYFRAGLAALGFSALPGESAIVPLIVGETAFAIAMSDRLLAEGVFVTGFGFPVVPEGAARIRIQLSAAHKKKHLDKAMAALQKVGKELGLI
ncbi:MAG: glycine C-acetyltransferase [Candidatus Eremiobacteraeota bacterium]|nr:glycine C-acetyltransferase [Candidatus Eremiobacteraeota bacterium]